MKKVVIIAGIAILALTVVTCSFFDQPEAAAVKPRVDTDANGQKWVTMDIVTGGGGGAKTARNMTQDSAEVLINYYEVMFFDAAGLNGGGEYGGYYRAAGRRGQTLTIRLPMGMDLSGPEAAIAFGGYMDKKTEDKTLLATAIVTHLNFGVTGTTNTLVVDTNTVNIRFLLSAISTRFDMAAAANFQITGTTPATNAPYLPAGATGALGYATGTASLNNITTVTPAGSGMLNHTPPDPDDKKIYPYWKLPKNDSQAAGGVPVTGANATATYHYGIDPTHVNGVHTDIEDGFRFDSYANFTGNVDDGLTAVRAEPTVTDLEDVPVPDPMNITITMFEEPLNEGYCVLILNLPVRAITTKNPHPRADWWTLRNGASDSDLHDNTKIFNTTLPNSGAAYGDDDTGKGSVVGVSLGGALLLCIGEPESMTKNKPIRIKIDWWIN